MSATVPTAIVDKNGVLTTRHKRTAAPVKSRLVTLASTPPKFQDDPRDTFSEVNNRMHEAISMLTTSIAERVEYKAVDDVVRLSKKLTALSDAMSVWETITRHADSIEQARDEFNTEMKERISNSSPLLNEPEISGYTLALGYMKSADFQVVREDEDVLALRAHFAAHIGKDVIVTDVDDQQSRGILIDNWRHDMYFLVQDGERSDEIDMFSVASIEEDESAPKGSFTRRAMSNDDKEMVASVAEVDRLSEQWLGIKALTQPGEIEVQYDRLYGLTSDILDSRGPATGQVPSYAMTGLMNEVLGIDDAEFDDLISSKRSVSIPVSKIRQYVIEVAVSED